jgi:hypothetical protein
VFFMWGGGYGRFKALTQTSKPQEKEEKEKAPPDRGHRHRHRAQSEGTEKRSYRTPPPPPPHPFPPGKLEGDIFGGLMGTVAMFEIWDERWWRRTEGARRNKIVTMGTGKENGVR